ncbi:metallophosphoesterase family protein [Anaerofilum hominis]|uniref:metallophosphoesterase family protein n=1 Tax=Anaerofilum hominis TaxID=2763016 RepID=UPI001FAC2474|nr:metallophosphoesterase [Anaerofilum hominis]
MGLIYVTADLHGDADRLKEAAVKRLKRQDTLIVLGDFGFLWRGDKEEQKLLKWLGKRPYTLLFLDGAHENYDLLRDYPAEPYAGGRARHISGRLYHLLRGEVYTIENKKLLCFGGGESEDRLDREEGETWWRSELPAADELDNCREKLGENGGRVDYILTHTPPYRLRRFLLGEAAETNRLETFLDEVADQMEYRCWYFGRYHLDRAVSSRAVAVYRKVLPLWAEPQKKLFRRDGRQP